MFRRTSCAHKSKIHRNEYLRAIRNAGSISKSFRSFSPSSLLLASTPPVVVNENLLEPEVAQVLGNLP
jgi:hypothetical protein